MYFVTIQQFAKTLKNLDHCLDKATAFAESKKFDVNNFCTQRLAPDMFPMARQIQIACDVAKTAAGQLSGTEAPKFEDKETTIPELRERIRKTHAFLESLNEDSYKKTTTTTPVKLTHTPGKAMQAQDLLLSRATPNFFFHVSMTYALLRAGGVDLGKKDYLGELKLIDA